jgi:hypothetical protein
VLPFEHNLLDGAWHRIRIPLVKHIDGPAGFDAHSVFERRLKTHAPEPITGSVFIDTLRVTAQG